MRFHPEDGSVWQLIGVSIRCKILSNWQHIASIYMPGDCWWGEFPTCASMAIGVRVSKYVKWHNQCLKKGTLLHMNKLKLEKAQFLSTKILCIWVQTWPDPNYYKCCHCMTKDHNSQRSPQRSVNLALTPTGRHCLSWWVAAWSGPFCWQTATPPAELLVLLPIPLTVPPCATLSLPLGSQARSRHTVTVVSLAGPTETHILIFFL